MRKGSTTRYYVLLAAALLWMAVIFFKSAESYQQQSLRPLLSSWFHGMELTNSIPHWEFAYDHDLVSWQDPIGLIEFFIRKAGHVSEYAILALLWCLTLLAKPMRVVMALVTSFIISVLYAITDEWHQTFVSGRTGHAVDVAIDTIGMVLAIIIVLLGLFIRSKVRRRTSL
ncbi:VanZ family protein [Paenibacillus sp. SI8]|uniref:VanZ family protein n=1 Tax=unclassified Paenibacillus TaxID=185978 RepID=UPI003465C80F